MATPVLDRLRVPGEGVVRSVSGGTVYVQHGGFVVALTAAGVPRMPNGIALAGGEPLSHVRPGSPARLGAGAVRAGRLEVRWRVDDPPAWSPRIVPLGPAAARETLELLGAFRALPPGEVLASPSGREAVTAVTAGAADGDRRAMRDAARALLGRGPGLTPEGDDLLCGTLAALHALGPVAGVRDRALRGRAAALRPDAGRTTSLSETLLRLAVDGHALQPVLEVLRPEEGARSRARALERLLGIGGSTGRAIVAGLHLGAAALLSGSERMG